MKKVIVLGAGRGQIPLMNLLHKYGYHVITVSPEGDYPGFAVADSVFYADITDRKAVLEYARREKICGITTDQLDESVFTAAYVAEQMGLPGITSEVARKFTNKYIMRKAAEAAGIRVPFSICVHSIEEAKKEMSISNVLDFPVMIKPLDRSASRGVYKVNNIGELQKRFEIAQEYSSNKKVIIEQFITGKEYVVDAFTRNYAVTNLVVGHRDYFNVSDTFIPNATVFSDANSANTKLEQRLKLINEQLVKAFGLSFGITHAEYLYDNKSNQIYLVEIAARGGGAFISSELIPAATGVNANDLLIREVVGMEDNTPIIINPGASAYFCYLTPKGTVEQLSGTDEVEKIPGVRKAFFDNIELGMKTNSIKDKSSRKGPILVQGKTKAECYDIIEKVKRCLDIKVMSENGLEDILWK